MEMNRIALQAEDIEPMTLENVIQESVPAPAQPAPKPRREAVVRYTLLVVIALMLGWLGYYVQSSLNELNSDLEKTHASLVTEGSLGPD